MLLPPTPTPSEQMSTFPKVRGKMVGGKLNKLYFIINILLGRQVIPSYDHNRTWNSTSGHLSSNLEGNENQEDFSLQALASPHPKL